MAKNRLESQWDFNENEITPNYLDLLTHRHVSNEIATLFNIEHESPQIILVKNGVCIYHASHSDIRVADIKLQIQ